jgi:hypothetical protein
MFEEMGLSISNFKENNKIIKQIRLEYQEQRRSSNDPVSVPGHRVPQGFKVNDLLEEDEVWKA